MEVNKSTVLMDEEEIESFMDGIHEKQKKTGSNKPFTKKKDTTNNRPFTKWAGQEKEETRKAKAQKLNALKELKSKELGKIIKRHLPGFSIGKPINSGGFSKVYELIDGNSGKVYAVKVIDLCMAYREQFDVRSDVTLGMLDDNRNFQFICRLVDREMAINEIITNRSLSHCVRYYKDLSFTDESERKGVVFLVMDRMEGDLSMRPACLSKSVENHWIAYEMLLQTLEDMQFLSEHNGKENIFSRDIKPKNILYRRNGNKVGYYLSDFGMASIGGEYSNNTRMMENSYTAPEVTKDIRSELFALSRIAFYICNGFTLGNAIGDSNEFQGMQEQEECYWNHTPKKLRDIIQKATDPDPGKRYPSASEMLKSVQTLDFDRDRKIAEETDAKLVDVIGRLEKRHLEEMKEKEAEILALNKQLADNEKRIQELENTVNSGGDQIQKLNSQIIEKNEDIRKLQKENERLSAALELAQTELKELSEKVEKLKKSLRDKDSSSVSLLDENGRLKAQIAEQEKKIQELEGKERKLKELLPRITELQEKNALLETTSNNLQGKLDASEKRTSELEKKINDNSLLDRNEDATVSSIAYDVLKTLAFIFWFVYLILSNRTDLLPWMIVVYMASILMNAVSARIAMRKNGLAFCLYAGVLTVAMLIFGLAFLRIEWMIPFFPKNYGAELPFIGLRVSFGIVSACLNMFMLTVEDVVIGYAKYVKNEEEKVDEITNSVLMVNIVLIVAGIILLAI